MSTRDTVATLPCVADRKPKARVIVEVEEADKPFIRDVRVAALLKGIPLRQYVLAALREKYERDQTE